MPRQASGTPHWEALAVKLPPQMMEELRRYTDNHRLPLSELVREGILLRMQQGGQKQEANGYPLSTDTTDEPIDIAALLSVAWEEHAQLPDCPAVYFVFDGHQTLLYVGKTLSLAARWRSHKHKQELQARGATRLAWLPLSPLVLDMVEALLIEHLGPLLNKPLGRPLVYQDEETRPVHVSVSFPHELYDQGQQYARAHNQTLAQVVREGVEMRLAQPADLPEESRENVDDIAARKLQEMVDAAVQKALARERTAPPVLDAAPPTPVPEEPGLPAHEIAHDDNTVIQAKAPRGSSPPGQYKLTSRQVASLRAKRQRGAPIKALMEEYGISKATLFRYLK